MLIAAAVCPHPPLLIPAALGAAAGEPPAPLAAVTDACDRAVRALLAAGPELVAVVGGGPADREYGPGTAGSLADYGVPAVVGEGETALPLSLTVGRWLLSRAGIGDGQDGPELLFQAVGQQTAPGDCRKLGIMIADRAAQVAHGQQAQEYDEDVAEALAAADARWLARLDPAQDEQLLVAGRAAWQVLAGAATGTRLHGRLLCMCCPYGVTYLVATWEQGQAG